MRTIDLSSAGTGLATCGLDGKVRICTFSVHFPLLLEADIALCREISYHYIRPHTDQFLVYPVSTSTNETTLTSPRTLFVVQVHYPSYVVRSTFIRRYLRRVDPGYLKSCDTLSKTTVARCYCFRESDEGVVSKTCVDRLVYGQQ